MRTTTPRRGLSGQWGTRLTRVRVKKGIPLCVWSRALGLAHFMAHLLVRRLLIFLVWICSTSME